MMKLPLPIGRGRTLPRGRRSAIMAICNATPDSFSDGGEHATVEAAVAFAREALADGADILDVGGESTRPGAEAVSAVEECARVVPIIRALIERLGALVSIDTTKAAVFEEAYRAGASILNDVSGLSADPELGPALARTDAAVVLMHRRGTPKTMDSLSHYEDLVQDVKAELTASLSLAEAAGIPQSRCILDPGIGFAKKAEDNWTLLANLEALRTLNCPLLVGASRKRFLGQLSGAMEPKARDTMTAVLSALLGQQGVECLRVHAVKPTHEALLVQSALCSAEGNR